MASHGPFLTPDISKTRDASPLALALSQRLLIGFLFAFPVVYFIYPVCPRFFSAIASLPEGDSAMNLWTFWHTSNALMLRDEPAYSTMRLLAPVGSTLTFHTLCLFPTLLTVPLTSLGGPYAGFNLLLVLAQLLAGYGSYKLVARLTRCPLCGAFAAFALEMSPTLHFRLINHYSLAYLGFIPLLMERVLNDAEPAEPAVARRRRLITAAIACACFMTDYNIFIMAVFCLGVLWMIMLAAALPAKDRERLKRILLTAGWTGGGAVALFLVWAWLTPFQDYRFWWNNNLQTFTGNGISADMAFYLIPDTRHWVFAGRLPGAIQHASRFNPEQYNDLGLTNLALFIPGLWYLGRRNRPAMIALLLLSALCFNLSLGYGACSLGRPFGPGSLWEKLLLFPRLASFPLLQQARIPARWAIPLLVCVIAGAGCGVRGLCEMLPAGKGRTLVPLILAGLVLIEFAHQPTPWSAFPAPRAYRSIGTAPTATAMIIESPICIKSGTKGIVGDDINPDAMAWSIDHRYRTVNGYLSRIGSYGIVSVLNQPLIRDLWMLQGGRRNYLCDTAPTQPATIKRWIVMNDVQYIVIDKRRESAGILKFIRDNDIALPVEDDGRYLVMKTRR